MLAETGGCFCGNLGYVANFTQSREEIVQRVCDCDFCRMHVASFVSDPKGSLAITIRDGDKVSLFRQGSGRAEFLICCDCGVLVGVMYTTGENTYGAINSKTMKSRSELGPEVAVSPKTLGPEAKTERWMTAWFANVSVNSRTNL